MASSSSTLLDRALARARSYLPSRNWLIFIGSVSGFASIVAYDRHKAREVKRELKSRAAVVAEQPLHFHERARNVIVYLSPTQYSERCFNDFVKPVFDAAALDYTVISSTSNASLRTTVMESIWTGKEELEKERVKEREKQRVRASSWVPRWTRREEQESSVEKLLREIAIQYRPEDGLVAVGPEAWITVIKSVNDAYLSDRPTQPVTALGSGDSILTTANDGSNHGRPTELDGFSLPPLGYITCRNYTGWGGVPARMYWWFNKRVTMRNVGEEALQIALDRKRPFSSETDLTLGDDDIRGDFKPLRSGEEGWTGIDEGVGGKLSVYQTKF
ncbi:inner membrane protein import complex subunit Tim54-domain-containing protein [Zopfochytrium polystomum]|nr:inner membrane protein import complex subunit Tim54-domain-containing protein [Zopfochytrium polystomum]